MILSAVNRHDALLVFVYYRVQISVPWIRNYTRVVNLIVSCFWLKTVTVYNLKYVPLLSSAVLLCALKDEKI